MWYVIVNSIKKSYLLTFWHFLDKIPNCIENPANPLTCFYKDQLYPQGTFDEAKQECNDMLGYLPRPYNKLQAEKLWEIRPGSPIWIGLVTETNPLVYIYFLSCRISIVL